jgi:hypothetical protein
LCRCLDPDPDQALDLPSIQSHRWLVQPCSAYTGDKLVDGLDWLVRDVADRVYYSSPAIPVEEKEKDVVAAKINTAGNLTAWVAVDECSTEAEVSSTMHSTTMLNGPSYSTIHLEVADTSEPPCDQASHAIIITLLP